MSKSNETTAAIARIRELGHEFRDAENASTVEAGRATSLQGEALLTAFEGSSKGLFSPVTKRGEMGDPDTLFDAWIAGQVDADPDFKIEPSTVKQQRGRYNTVLRGGKLDHAGHLQGEILHARKGVMGELKGKDGKSISYLPKTAIAKGYGNAIAAVCSTALRPENVTKYAGKLPRSLVKEAFTDNSRSKAEPASHAKMVKSIITNAVNLRDGKGGVDKLDDYFVTRIIADAEALAGRIDNGAVSSMSPAQIKAAANETAKRKAPAKRKAKVAK